MTTTTEIAQQGKHERKFEDMVSNIEEFGQAYTLMVNLSRYLDMVSSSVMAGNISDSGVLPFVRKAREVYGELRTMILTEISDDQLRGRAERMFRGLDGVENVLEAALIVDQAQAWLESELKHGAFTHRMNMMSLQLGLETAATNAQLGEQLEKAKVFESRTDRGGMHTGNYV
jgi:hypothetical protein